MVSVDWLVGRVSTFIVVGALGLILFGDQVPSWEGRLHPVVSPLSVSEVTPCEGCDTPQVAFVPSFKKWRDCPPDAPRGSPIFLRVHAKDGRLLAIEFAKSAVPRAFSRPIGAQTDKPWIIYGVNSLDEIASVTADHVCHPLWSTRTPFPIVVGE